MQASDLFETNAAPQEKADQLGLSQSPTDARGEAPAVAAVEDEAELTPEAITPAQWDRILDGRKVRWLVKPEQVTWAGKRAVSCGACVHTKMHGDPRRGWCVEQRFLVSMAFPVLCRRHVARDASEAAAEPDEIVPEPA